MACKSAIDEYMLGIQLYQRVRYISNQYREEILDFALSKLTPSVEQQLLLVPPHIHTASLYNLTVT